MRLWAISLVNVDATASFEMEETNQPDYQLLGDLFKNESIYDPTNDNSSATNQTRVLWGIKLDFYTVAISLTILALVFICGLLLCIEQRRLSFLRREINIERQFQMRHINRPPENLIPRRDSFTPSLRVTPQGNTEQPSSQIILPTDNTGASEAEERDSQEAPKELLITALTFQVGTAQGDTLPFERLSEMMIISADIPHGSGITKGKIIGEDMDLEKNAAEKTGGGCKSDKFFPMMGASKAFKASA